MTPGQKEGIARAEAKIEPAMELYRLRNRIAYMVGRLGRDELEEVVKVLDALNEYELSLVARYARGLADFRSAAQESVDAQGSLSSSPTDADSAGG
jgi:hypothetical protein